VIAEPRFGGLRSAHLDPDMKNVTETTQIAA